MKKFPIRAGKKAVSNLAAVFFMLSGGALSACTGGVGGVETPDYNADVAVVAPENIIEEHFVAQENTTYYTSQSLSLWMEVAGHYRKMEYFFLDGNKRVYDNLFFYEDDYFLMASDDMKGWYAALSDSADFAYAEVEKESGEDIQINVKKSGIYTLIFDVDTLKFDLEYKGEMESPLYYTMKNCSIFTLETEWVEMGINPENEEEFFIENFALAAGKSVRFFNSVHTSNYKVTLDEACADKYASAKKADVTVNVGGNYNVYVNKKTYVVRMELLNPDEAAYSCVYYDGKDFITLSPEPSAPYLFKQRLVVDAQYMGLPDFHSAQYRTYALTPEPSEFLMRGSEDAYFKKTGTYDLIINLKTFSISVELVAE